MRRHFYGAGINFKAHLVPTEYSSFDQFPKSNLLNENIKVTQRQNFWISSARRFTVTCSKGFCGSLPLDETEYCQQTIRRNEAIASVIYEGDNNKKIFLEWLGDREIEHAVQITCKRYNSFGRRLVDMNAGSMYVLRPFSIVPYS